MHCTLTLVCQFIVFSLQVWTSEFAGSASAAHCLGATTRDPPLVTSLGADPLTTQPPFEGRRQARDDTAELSQGVNRSYTLNGIAGPNSRGLGNLLCRRDSVDQIESLCV